MKLESAAPAMGLRVGQLNLAKDGDRAVGELRGLLLEHQLLVITKQQLTSEQLMDFGHGWGDLMTHPSSMAHPNPYVQTLANQGKVKGKGFGAWHSDMTWHPTPPRITMLHAQRVPGSGGDTGYANQHLAYESLDRASRDKRRMFRRHLATQEELVGLSAFHVGKGFGEHVPDSVHPVVRTHDETGRKALYVNPEFTSHVIDVTEHESERLLWPLWLHAVAEEFTYRHRWSPGDLLIWDNRSVMHTAILDYDEPRSMSRIVIQGNEPV